jgi:hypothetical protein
MHLAKTFVRHTSQRKAGSGQWMTQAVRTEYDLRRRETFMNDKNRIMLKADYLLLLPAGHGVRRTKSIWSLLVGPGEAEAN